ncbi:MAG: beta-galactosidase [Victivallis sp.]
MRSPEGDFEAGGYRPFLDWREFTAWNRTCKFNLVRSWIRSADPDTPVISHMCWPGDADIFGEEDILGTSIYTIHAQGKSDKEFPRMSSRPIRTSTFCRREGGFRRDPEGFWVVETEAGPVSWVHNLVPRGYSPRKMNARDLLFVAHGARAVLRWLYRSRISDAQAGEFNLVGWDGRITDRAAAFGELCALPE